MNLSFDTLIADVLDGAQTKLACIQLVVFNN